jgi:hypothetical protein
MVSSRPQRGPLASAGQVGSDPSVAGGSKPPRTFRIGHADSLTEVPDGAPQAEPQQPEGLSVGLE